MGTSGNAMNRRAFLLATTSGLAAGTLARATAAPSTKLPILLDHYQPDPIALKLRALVQSGRLGRIRRAQASYLAGPGSESRCRDTLDRLLFITGETSPQHLDIAGDGSADHNMMTARYSTGLIILVTSQPQSSTPRPLFIRGEHASLVCQNGAIRLLP